MEEKKEEKEEEVDEWMNGRRRKRMPEMGDLCITPS